MTHIVSGKQFRVVIEGELPPGLPPGVAGEWVASALSFNAQMAALVRAVNITAPVSDAGPQREQRQ